MKAILAEPDQAPRYASSDLVMDCLLMSHKKETWLKCVKAHGTGIIISSYQ